MKSVVWTLALSWWLSLALAQWEPEVRLTWNDSSSSTSFNNVRSIAAGARGTVHVVWSDHRTGVDQIYYKRSTDRGATWSLDTNLTDTSGMKSNPNLAVVGETLHLVWEDHRYGYPGAVMYRRSTDNGATWLPEQRIHANNWNIRNPAVAAEGSTVHVAWASDSAGREIYYCRSTDNGVTWTERRRLTFDMQESWYPSIAASGQFVHLAWRDWRDHSFEIYYLRSCDRGATWESLPVRLSGDLTTGSYNPSLCVSDSHVHVVWFDTRHTPFELYYRSSTDNGATWSSPELRITEDTTGSYNPSICAAGPNVHVVWEALYGTADIYHKMSTDYGTTWGPETRLTQDQFYSVFPSAALVDSGIHVVWTDFRDNENGEIYYKRNLSGNRVAIVEPSEPTAGVSKSPAIIVCGVIFLPAVGVRRKGLNLLLDISGRTVMELMPGPNDVRQLAPGVYFITSLPEEVVTKVVVMR
ncbi:MAG: sialidase family protein [candidate division WOR-3 bacterium]